MVCLLFTCKYRGILAKKGLRKKKRRRVTVGVALLWKK